MMVTIQKDGFIFIMITTPSKNWNMNWWPPQTLKKVEVKHFSTLKLTIS